MFLKHAYDAKDFFHIILLKNKKFSSFLYILYYYKQLNHKFVKVLIRKQ